MIEFDEFEKLSTDKKIQYLDSHSWKEEQLWFERLEEAWEHKSPNAIIAWDWLKDVYWEMVKYNRKHNIK
jgi:hypothetical protein